MNRKWLLPILLIVGTTLLELTKTTDAAAYASDNSSIELTELDLGTTMQMYYKALQQVMPCGYPPMNLPILDPYKMNFMILNYSNPYYTLKGNISNLVIRGLSDFNFIAATYNETTNRTTFDLIFPQVQVLSEYMCNIWALLAGYPAIVAGKGLLNVKIVDFRMIGELTLAPSIYNASALRVSDFNLHFYFGDVIFDNWNDLWDIAENNFVNRWLREITMMWSEQMQVQIDSVYSQLLLPNLNGYLAEMSMEQLIQYFVSTSMDFNMANCTLKAGD